MRTPARVPSAAPNRDRPLNEGGLGPFQFQSALYRTPSPPPPPPSNDGWGRGRNCRGRPGPPCAGIEGLGLQAVEQRLAGPGEKGLEAAQNSGLPRWGLCHRVGGPSGGVGEWRRPGDRGLLRRGGGEGGEAEWRRSRQKLGGPVLLVFHRRQIGGLLQRMDVGTVPPDGDSMQDAELILLGFVMQESISKGEERGWEVACNMQTSTK